MSDGSLLPLLQYSMGSRRLWKFLLKPHKELFWTATRNVELYSYADLDSTRRPSRARRSAVGRARARHALVDNSRKMLLIIILSSRRYLKYVYGWNLTTALLWLTFPDNLLHLSAQCEFRVFAALFSTPPARFCWASGAALRTYQVPGTLVNGHRSLATNAD